VGWREVIDDPTFRLSQITAAMGEALAALEPTERAATRRQVDLVLQGTIDRLKALPAEVPVYVKLPQKSDN
jgi:hypothetical protein